VVQQFKYPGTAELQQLIYEGIAADFAAQPRAWDLQARRHCSPADAGTSPEALQAAQQQLQQGLRATGGSLAMYGAYTAFLSEHLRALLAAGDAEQVQAAAKLAQQLFKLYQEGADSPSPSPSSSSSMAAEQQEREQLFCSWVQLALKLKQPKIALKAARRGCDRLPSSAAAWRQRLQLELQLRSARQAPAAQLHEAIKGALALVPADGAPALWLLALEALQGSPEDLLALQGLLVRLQSCRAQGPVEGGMGAVAAAFLGALQQQQGPEAVRALVQQLLRVPATGGEFFKAAIRLEEQLPPQAGGGQVGGSRVRELYEAAVAAYGEVDPSLWLGYAQLEQRSGRSAGQVYWRATRALAEPDPFIEQYRQVVGLA
jgi:U3 small nucleolar RNA-associated protein 6